MKNIALNKKTTYKETLWKLVSVFRILLNAQTD